MLAQTKIWPVKGALTKTPFEYVFDPTKTTLRAEVAYVKNGHGVEAPFVLTSAWNCTPENAYGKIMFTQLRYNLYDKKKNPVVLYHMDQSFAAGEISPQKAFEVGCKLAEEVFGDRFEVVMGVHVNTTHIHNHFLINPVSFVDGHNIRSEASGMKAFYFSKIREASDRLCRENELSVIGETYDRTLYREKNGHYEKWDKEKKQKYAESFPERMTKRDLIRLDVDEVLENARTMDEFILGMKKKGYVVKASPDVIHMAVKKKGQDRFTRVRSLGIGYNEESITKRLEYPDTYRGVACDDPEQFWTVRRGERYLYTPIFSMEKNKPSRRQFVRYDRSGLFSWYYKYLYVFGLHAKKSYKKQIPVPRKDVLRFRQMTEQFAYMQKHNIQTSVDLDHRVEALAETEAEALFSRNRVYDELKNIEKGDDKREKCLVAKREVNADLRAVRRELVMCRRIGGEDQGTQDMKTKNIKTKER